MPRAAFSFVIFASSLMGCDDAKIDVDPKQLDEMAQQDFEDLDRQVLAALLEDLVSYSGRDAADVNLDEQGRLLVSTKAKLEGDFGYSPRRLPRYDEARWNGVSDADLNAAEEAWEILLRRAKRPFSFATIMPQDGRFAALENYEAAADPFGENRPISAFPFGYSQDKTLAVVEFEFPWSEHHGRAIYLLREKEGQWTVIFRAYVHYV